jgi:DNA-binding SARP family transcriptional activator
VTVTSSRDGAPGGRGRRGSFPVVRIGSDGAAGTGTVAGAVPPEGAGSRIRLRLLGRFELTIDGVPRTVPIAGRPVLAVLALTDAPIPALDLAAAVWPGADRVGGPERLRCAMASLERAGLDLVDERDGVLALRPGVRVDVADLIDRASWLSDPPASERVPLDDAIAEARRWGELLPGWSEDRILIERERVRRIRLRVLEHLAERALREGRTRDAIDLGGAAVDAEPLRERAWGILIRAHLAAGDVPAAIRRYDAFRRLLAGDLGLAPSIVLEELVPPLTVA